MLSSVEESQLRKLRHFCISRREHVRSHNRPKLKRPLPTFGRAETLGSVFLDLGDQGLGSASGAWGFGFEVFGSEASLE